MELEVHGPFGRLKARADRESFAGYCYRDPAGHDLYVAQSDLADYEWAGGQGRAALELHLPYPLPEQSYLPW